MTIAGRWRESAAGRQLHVIVSVQNIGASKVDLIQAGTGLDLYVLVNNSPPYTEWKHRESVPFLQHHHWIEPGETVNADLIAPIVFEDAPVLTRASLHWKRLGASEGVLVVCDKIIWPRGGGHD